MLFLSAAGSMDIVRQKLVFPVLRYNPVILKGLRYPRHDVFIIYLIACGCAADMQTPHNRFLRYTKSFKTQ